MVWNEIRIYTYIIKVRLLEYRKNKTSYMLQKKCCSFNWYFYNIKEDNKIYMKNDFVKH